MKIKRIIQEQIEQRLTPGKVVILLGPRQVGKTTLLKDILAKRRLPIYLFPGKTVLFKGGWEAKVSKRFGKILESILCL